MKKHLFKEFKAVGMRHKGHSYAEIQEATKIPLATLSRWLSHLRLNEKAKEQIQQRKKAANQKARERSWRKATERRVTGLDISVSGDSL